MIDISMEWTEDGCVMITQGIALNCPLCGATVLNDTHKCGDKKPKPRKKKGSSDGK